MFVFGQGAPHATVDAVAQARDEGDGGVFGRGFEGAEDKFGGGKLGNVFFEGGLPGGGGNGEVGGCGGHGAGEGAETE